MHANQMAWVVVLLLGCTPGAKTSPTPADSSTDTDTASPSPSDSASPDDTAQPARCPDDMAPVPSDDPIYCIDRWETALSEDRTSFVSQPGQRPHVNISFDESRELCANTPMVIDGEVVGWRRLATLTEWGDAYDGVVGAGGSTYATGEEWPDDICALPTESGEQTYDDLQPTGSLPECVSVFGVYDQVGNSWEWADPEVNISVSGFLEKVGEAGVVLEVDADGQMTTTAAALDGLKLEIPGLRGTLAVNDEGVVIVANAIYEAALPFDYTGYIGVDEAAGGSRSMLLPVVVEQPPEEFAEVEAAAITTRWSEDGAPITAKVGCAYYSGGPNGCSAQTWFSGHPHDFRGTISARCAGDPVR